MAVIATACTEGIDTPVRTREIRVSIPGSLPFGGIAYEAGSAQSVVSKAVFSDGEGMSWENADAEKLGIIAGAGNEWASFHSTGISIAEDKGATFTASVPENATRAYFVYPYSAGADNGTVHRFCFPAELTQTKAGSSENFRFASAESTDISESAASIKPSLKMVGSVVRTVIYSASGNRAAESVTAVKLETKSSGAFVSATEYDYELAGGTANVGGTCGSSVRVALSEAYSLEGRTGKDNASAVYLPIVPVTTEGFMITVYTNAGATYIFDSSTAKTWEGGQLYTFYLNLDKGTRSVSVEPRFWVWTEWGTNQTCTISRSVPATAGQTQSDSYHIAINGTDATAEQRGWCRIESTGDWVSARLTETNQYLISYQENTTGEERKADINIFFDSPFGNDDVTLNLWGNEWSATGSLQMFQIHIIQAAE